jgi:hypothetical protein
MAHFRTIGCRLRIPSVVTCVMVDPPTVRNGCRSYNHRDLSKITCTRDGSIPLVCRSSLLAETRGYAVSFSRPWRGKRRVFERHKPLLTDQLQPSTNADKLSDKFNGLRIFMHQSPQAAQSRKRMLAVTAAQLTNKSTTLQHPLNGTKIASSDHKWHRVTPRLVVGQVVECTPSPEVVE